MLGAEPVQEYCATRSHLRTLPGASLLVGIVNDPEGFVGEPNTDVDVAVSATGVHDKQLKSTVGVPAGSLAAASVPLAMLAAFVVSVVAEGANAVPPVLVTETAPVDVLIVASPEAVKPPNASALLN
jgi:hypothetical protein